MYAYSAVELEKTGTLEQSEEELLGLFELHNGQHFLWLHFFSVRLESYCEIKVMAIHGISQ
jgi:hypothetical protein